MGGSDKKCDSCKCKNSTTLRIMLWVFGLACLVMTVLLQTKIVEIDDNVIHNAVTHAMPFLAATCNVSATILHLKNIRDKANITDENAKKKGWRFHVVHIFAIISCLLITAAPFLLQYGGLCSVANSSQRLLLTVILPASFVVGGGLFWLGMHWISYGAKYNRNNLALDLENAEKKGYTKAVQDMTETKEGNQITIAASPTKPSANPPVSSTVVDEPESPPAVHEPIKVPEGFEGMVVDGELVYYNDETDTMLVKGDYGYPELTKTSLSPKETVRNSSENNTKKTPQLVDRRRRLASTMRILMEEINAAA